MLWTGNPSKNDSVTVNGSCCYTIQPEVVINNDHAVYKFDKKFINDIGISMAPKSSTGITTQESSSHSDPLLGNQRNCYLCSSKVPLDKMRVHVGKHILNEETNSRTPCGFCGRSSCQNKLTKPTRKGN